MINISFYVKKKMSFYLFFQKYKISILIKIMHDVELWVHQCPKNIHNLSLSKNRCITAITASYKFLHPKHIPTVEPDLWHEVNILS